MPWDLCLLDACGQQKEQGSENEEGKFQPMEQLAWNGKLTVRYRLRNDFIPEKN